MEYRLQDPVGELLSRRQPDIVTIQLLYGPFFCRGVRLLNCAHIVRFQYLSLVYCKIKNILLFTFVSLF